MVMDILNDKGLYKSNFLIEPKTSTMTIEKKAILRYTTKYYN